MANFSSKILGLAGVAMVFAGVSYGQTIQSCTTLSAQPGPLSLRAEGTTELVADGQFSCTNNGGASAGNGTVQLFMSAPVTSKLQTGSSSVTEATLFICATAAACAGTSGNTIPGPSTVYYGTVSGNSVSFANVSFPAATFGVHVSNIRVNANAVTLGTTLTSVSAQALVSVNNTSATSGSAQTVGYVFKSLATPSLVATPNGTGSATVTAYTACSGNPLPSTGSLSTISFLVPVSEQGQGGFFKIGGSATSTAASEGGSYAGANGSGVASFGTRLQFSFGNIPSVATLYMPQNVTVVYQDNAGGTHTFTLTMVSGPTTGTLAATGVTASTATGAPGAGTSSGSWSGFAGSAGGNNTYYETYTASVAITPSNGTTATAVYEVAATDNSVIETADIPVWVSFGAGSITSATSAITVVEGYAPQAASASATTVPNFAPVTAPVLNGTTISLCSTSLLFPFVTSQLGFDTGIALSNTSADPFGTANSAGTCTLNFYGTGAPSPSTNVPAPGASQAAGSVNTFLLSSVAAGFQGYMIAQCNYQKGHGFAYIAYSLGQNSGTAMGYVAQVLNRVSGVSSETLSQ